MSTAASCISRSCDRMRIGGQQIRREGSHDIAMTMSNLTEQITPFGTSDLIEFPPQHSDAGFRIDPCRAYILMPEEFLDIGDVHAIRQQPRRHGVTQQMRIDALLDAGITGDVTHHLSNPLSGIGAASSSTLFAADEQGTSPAFTDVHGKQASNFGPDGYLTPFPTLAGFDDDRPLGDADILDPQRDEFRNARTSFQQGLYHQACLAAPGVGGIDEAQGLFERQACRSTALFFRCLQARLRPCSLEYGFGLVVIDPLPQKDISNLIGDALDVASHQFSNSVSKNKSDCQIPFTKVRIHPEREECALRVFLSAYSGKLDRGYLMKIEIRLRIDTGDGAPHDDEVLVLDKPYDQLEQIGLSIDEAKSLLARLQERIVAAQAHAFAAEHHHCKECSASLRSKGKTIIRFRTAFGDVPITSPRLHRCACDTATARTFSPLADLFREHVAPEMLYLETKWASLVSFGVTVDLLKDVLPVGTTLNAATVRNHLHRVAARAEAELGDEQFSFIEDTPSRRARLPLPDGPIVVGVDGGYVRAREPDREGRQTNFEVMVGKSMAEDLGDRYFGLV